ncbi:response regulator transcription factor [Adhaeretor mobilis]|uniref:response regulator transcription factor n=1 Tax=Adhaeretor mobilis TaxID=1930276 RepID=UPI001FE3B060|nr:response regulator transcription factor [Adhaeretor mobilis]
MPTILTIEDDSAIRRGVVDALTYAGHEVLEEGDGTKGCDTALRRQFDLLLLDMVLPGKTGLEILAAVRNAKPTLPVIILSARGEENDRVSGLKLGADDYVVKPFSVTELLARVEAVLRRSPSRPTDVQQLDLSGTRIDFARSEAITEDTRTELSEKECDLLRYLARHQGRAVPREELLENVWQIDARGISTRTVDMHVARLREKLGPEAIATVRGRGYMIGGP